VSTVDLYTVDKWPLKKLDEIEALHFNEIRRHMWLAEHPYAGNQDVMIMYGKWVGSASEFKYVPYDYGNWATSWESETDYHYGLPIVLFKWGSGDDQIDLFIWNSVGSKDVLKANPPVLAGQVINPRWYLFPNPNIYSHWNKNAGRPDIGADGRYFISQHGWDPPPGGVGWMFGTWKAYQELPIQVDPWKQVPRVKDIRGDRERHFPVEYHKEDVTTIPDPTHIRSFQDGSIGAPPTYWPHNLIPSKIDEYVRLNGDPMDSMQVGDDYRTYKKNMSHQDRIHHLISQNYFYKVEVDDFWKKAWNRWCMYGVDMNPTYDFGCANSMYDYANNAGIQWLPYVSPHWSTYYIGNAVWHASFLWRCIKDTGGTVEPGVHADWEDYWVKTDLHQPDFVDSDPIYVQFSDYLHHCNSSAFEKVLKDIGEYDWYFDTDYPAMPWWMYQNYYYLMMLEESDPGVGHKEDAEQRWPRPRGCWRRIWRYTQAWNTARNQCSRFGKEIDIDGKMVSMMWPGELGNPPGYDLQLQYHGTHANGTTYDAWFYQHLITQQEFDNMQTPVGEEWKYNQYYVVVPVEDMFKQAYRNNPAVERFIRERHDPQTTHWENYYNPGTGLFEWREYPIYEIYADMVNDMKEALLQLNFVASTKTKEIARLYWGSDQDSDFSDPVAAYRYGKAGPDYEVQGSGPFPVGYSGYVYDGSVPPDRYWAFYSSGWGLETAKSLGRVTIITQDQDFPSSIAGSAMIRVRYKTTYTSNQVSTEVIDDCKIGFGDIFLQDSRRPTGAGDLTWKTAYLPLTAADFNWVYNATSEEWEYKCEHITNLLQDWPPESHFEEPYPLECKGWSMALTIDFSVNEDLILKIDFNGYDETVFAWDPYNYIER
jgi:hypothetical protein